MLLNLPGRAVDWPTRPPATGAGGMVATTQPAAARAGVETLREGGTAADAAVAVAFALFAAEPRSNGLGGDLMAQYWPADSLRPVVLNASGRAPEAMTLGAVGEVAGDTMPSTGPWSATVPGAVGGLVALHARFGRLPWSSLLAPAILAAREGVDVGPRTAADWTRSANRLPEGSVYREPPAEGPGRPNPVLAGTLERLARDPTALYRGELAARVAAHVESLGGPMRATDLAKHGVTWETPVHGDYRGCRVFELGPNTQGAVALMALSLLDRHPPTGGAADAERLVKAIALAFEHAARVIGDPRSEGSRPDADAARVLAKRLDDAAPLGPLPFPPGTDTVFTAIADGEGTLCALSTSLYEGFGSGVEVPGTGIVLHNRAAGFSLRPGPSQVGPGRRPYHTLVPAMAEQDRCRAALGFAGAFMQPQGQVQVLRRILDDGHDPQAAVDAPRLRLEAAGSVAVEPGLEGVGEAFAARGMHVVPLPAHRAGTGQLVAVQEARMTGGADRRHDGVALPVIDD